MVCEPIIKIVNDVKNLLDSIYSDGSCNFVQPELPKKGDKIKIKLQILESSLVTAVFVFGKQNGISRYFKMSPFSSSDGLVIYQAEIQIFENEFDYQFCITTKDQSYYYDQSGIYTYIPNEKHKFRILTDYTQPSWVKNAVFYQIFPDRFCNGDDSISVKDGEYKFDGYDSIRVKDWSSVPEDYSKAHCLDFYGGDLIGIRQKIPYLKKLGVTALYLNPIFYAATVHKYDCLDYFTVDPHLGGNKALEELTKALHENGMKIILDVSINHTGIANKWFNRDSAFFPKEVGAYNNPNSEEREYYFFNDNNTYKSWFEVSTLPTLNYSSQKLRNRLYKDSDSLVKKWLKAPYNIDGWRFDVADTMARNDFMQLHHEVWPEIRKSIKDENKDAYIIAEDWSDCSEFLNGNEWDSPMNYYGSCRLIRAFYGLPDFYSEYVPELRAIAKNITAEDMAMWLNNYLATLPHQIKYVLFNLFDSHDIARFHCEPGIIKGYIRGAAIMIFTLPGCANLYYGDEAEIAGTINNNEGSRYPMPWDKDIENTESYKMYSTLADIKTHNDVFKDGGFKIVWAKNQVFAFARFNYKEIWFTVLSSDIEERIIELPLTIFGNSFAKKDIPKQDALGESLQADIKDGSLFVKVPAGKAFLIKL